MDTQGYAGLHIGLHLDTQGYKWIHRVTSGYTELQVDTQVYM